MTNPSSVHVLLVAALIAVAVAVILVGGAAFLRALLDDPDGGYLDEPLRYTDEDWHQPSHVEIQPRPYDWAADAADQGWGGPLTNREEHDR